MMTDTDNDNAFIVRDILQELNCCSCFYEDINVNVIDIEDNENDNN